eukprot:g2890.t1
MADARADDDCGEGDGLLHGRNNEGVAGTPPGRPPYYYLGRDGGNYPGMKLIRLAFIRKVYGILLTQLAITVGCIAFFSLYTPAKEWVRGTPPGGNEKTASTAYGLTIGFSVLTMIMICAIACCEKPRRVWPHNYIFLFAFTIPESVMLGFISALYKTEAVLIAAGFTTFVVIALTIFAFQTRIDFSGWGIYLFVAFIVLILMSIFAAIFASRAVMIVVSSLIVMLFCFFLVYDTQMIVGMRMPFTVGGIACCAGTGNDNRNPAMRKNFYSIDDYCFAALNLYIVNIFIYVLAIVGGGDR